MKFINFIMNFIYYLPHSMKEQVELSQVLQCGVDMWRGQGVSRQATENPTTYCKMNSI